MDDKFKILFATDFSPGSKIALKTLKLPQKKYKKTHVSLIHVISSFWKDWITCWVAQPQKFCDILHVH